MKTYTPLPLSAVKISGGFWRERIDNIINDVIPYQWKALNDQIPDAEPSHAVENFRIAAGKSAGTFYGLIFQDSDIGKWIEAASYSLIDCPNPDLENIIDQVIVLIGLAQEPDGYLDTYFSMAAPDKKWTDFAMGHEMYCGGHLLEGAIAYFQATGKRNFLDIMIRYADHLDSHFGFGDQKSVAYCGHPEIELALYRLYELTGEIRYRELSRFFIEERGRHPEVIDNKKVIAWSGTVENSWHQADYYQDHAPVRDQHHADGHAVRAMYLFCAMTDQWRLSGDASLGEALSRLWESTVEKRMYVTGGLGSQALCERFTVDYDLPSDTAYAETCAAIGLIFWAWRMTLVSPERRYADTLERALYNGALSGISLDGTRYFYVNPLEVVPTVARARKDHDHVKTERVQWFGCACCPPNIARLICSVGQFQYSVAASAIYIHQFAAGISTLDTGNGAFVIVQTTDYPWSGTINFNLIKVPLTGTDTSFHIRVPGNSRDITILVNGTVVPVLVSANGYVEIKHAWSTGDIIIVRLAMPIQFIRSRPEVRETFGMVAIQRGPLVYCAEEIDNGPDLHLLRIDINATIQEEPIDGLGKGMRKIVATGFRVPKQPALPLYSDSNFPMEPCLITLVPYYSWGNRGPGEMRVWLETT